MNEAERLKLIEDLSAAKAAYVDALEASHKAKAVHTKVSAHYEKAKAALTVTYAKAKATYVKANAALAVTYGKPNPALNDAQKANLAYTKANATYIKTKAALNDASAKASATLKAANAAFEKANATYLKAKATLKEANQTPQA
ncbi:MAG: hypothetical protein WCI03_13500 [bacterium]|jgi:hypothetical protein